MGEIGRDDDQRGVVGEAVEDLGDLLVGRAAHRERHEQERTEQALQERQLDLERVQ